MQATKWARTSPQGKMLNFFCLFIWERAPSCAVIAEGENWSYRKSTATCLSPMCMQWATERTRNSAQWNLLNFLLDDFLRHFDGMDGYAKHLPVYQFFFFQNKAMCFFSMFLVTRPRSFWLKTKKKKKKKKNWGSQNQSCWPSVSCAQHLHVALADSIEWTSQFLHGYCDEEEELSPYP